VHGHTAGGTNPSLVEAMSFGNAVLAYNVSYNRHTTDCHACYWSSSIELITLLNSIDDISLLRNSKAMARIAAQRYTWSLVAEQYWSLLGLSESTPLSKVKPQNGL
jgi:glycosyltransferase involved in cell wall biosynthesis